MVSFASFLDIIFKEKKFPKSTCKIFFVNYQTMNILRLRVPKNIVVVSSKSTPRPVEIAIVFQWYREDI